ncbi:MAG: ATPase [Methanobacteriaceae archaeon]|nr:ATPase [Methanobacteriaceae archaeon]
MTRKIARFLQKIGVDNRFVSILPDQVLVNNVRFSRFSRAKEDLFRESFPEVPVVRSKMFQHLATRASRYLKNELKPRENVFLVKDDSCAGLTLYAVLEPYTRKYGINIFQGESWDDIKGLEVGKVALPFDLDSEVENLLEKMLGGDKISLKSDEKYQDGYELIYPLINVPHSWIHSGGEDSFCKKKISDDSQNISFDLPHEMVEFFSTFIPDVREKMYKSALFLREK